jgi:hypothetical protein
MEVKSVIIVFYLFGSHMIGMSVLLAQVYVFVVGVDNLASLYHV